MRITREDIIGILIGLPDEKLEVVYDFVSYLQMRALQTNLPEEIGIAEHDLFGEIPEAQMQAEDEKWNGLYAQHSTKTSAIAREAREDYLAG